MIACNISMPGNKFHLAAFQFIVKSRRKITVRRGRPGDSTLFGPNRPIGEDLLRRLIRLSGLLLVAYASSAWAPASPYDAKAIVQRSLQANAADWKAAPTYDYFERDEQAGGGTKTYQVLMIEGSPYQRLVAVNGQPLPEEQSAQEQQKLNATVTARRNEGPQARAKRMRQYQRDRERDHEMMQQLTEAFDFQLHGEQELDGYHVYVLQAVPRPGYQPPDMQTRVLTGMRGQLWIDKETFQWVKVEAEVIHPVSIVGFLARVEPGTRFEMEKMPVGDGVWQTKHFSMKAHAKVLDVFDHETHADETYYGYHKALSPTGESSGAAEAAKE
jgi:hypothetical protein